MLLEVGEMDERGFSGSNVARVSQQVAEAILSGK